MKLPNGDRAIIVREKIIGYALNFNNETGKHKARLFKSVLGITIDNSFLLFNALREQAATSDNARYTFADEYGRKYVIDFELSTDVGVATVRSSWIIRRNEDFPRLTSCYPLI